MIKALSGIFGGGTFKAIEKIASEWIQTDTERAEAKTLMIKTLDPNGLMRRNLSDRIAALYTLYIIVMLVLLICESFGLGGMNENNELFVAVATDKITDLFLPITSLFGVIVTASFGVNYQNIKQNK